MKRKFAAILAAVMLTHATPIWALDPASVKAYCDEIQQAAKNAQIHHLQTYQPRTDPVRIFDMSTEVCLNFITNFDLGFSLTIPSLGDLDAFLRRLATAILTRVCMAATEQFNRAVNDAMAAINQTLAPLNSVPGVNAGFGGTSAGSGGVNVSGGLGSDNGAMMNNATNRVVNMLPTR
jgi:hypothetical protein